MNTNFNPDETHGPQEDKTEYNPKYELTDNIPTSDTSKSREEPTYIGNEPATEPVAEPATSTGDYVHQQPPTPPTPTATQPRESWYTNFRFDIVVGTMVIGGLAGLIAYNAFNKPILGTKSIREKTLDLREYTSLVAEPNFYHFIRENNTGKSLSEFEKEVEANATEAYNSQKTIISESFEAKIKEANDRNNNAYAAAEKRTKEAWKWDVKKQTPEEIKVPESNSEHMKNIIKANERYKSDIKAYEEKNE